MTSAGMHQLPRREYVHLADIKPRSDAHINWEHRRHRQVHWLVECIAEFMGVFFYVFMGVGSTANFFFGSVTGTAGLSSMLQIGMAYSLGIWLAINVCGATSGGHFNPAVTLSFVLMRGMPKLKALRYVVAQLLGAYVAAMLIYVQWGQYIAEGSEILAAAGKLDAVMFTPNGPAGIFALYAPAGYNLGRIFLNEFVCDFLIGLVIWANLDPTNFGSSPIAGPVIVSFTYGACIWGYATVGIATNAARDVGTRLMAMSIWGIEAGGGKYAAIAALTNIPATLAAVMFYEYILADSSRVITPNHIDFLCGHNAHQEHSQGTIVQHNTSNSSMIDAKGTEQTIERV